jgi:uncharacterized coiled-coil DUF342 family protein
MDAVKEAVLEGKIDGLALRFERADQGNREEHHEMRGEIREVRSEIRDVRGEIRDVRGEIQQLNRTLALGFASIAASAVTAFFAAVIANAV